MKISISHRWNCNRAGKRIAIEIRCAIESFKSEISFIADAMRASGEMQARLSLKISFREPAAKKNVHASSQTMHGLAQAVVPIFLHGMPARDAADRLWKTPDFPGLSGSGGDCETAEFSQSAQWDGIGFRGLPKGSPVLL